MLSNDTPTSPIAIAKSQDYSPNISAIFKDFLNNFFKSNSSSHQEDNLGAKILDYLGRDLELQGADSADLTTVQT